MIYRVFTPHRLPTPPAATLLIAQHNSNVGSGVHPPRIPFPSAMARLPRTTLLGMRLAVTLLLLPNLFFMGFVPTTVLLPTPLAMATYLRTASRYRSGSAALYLRCASRFRARLSSTVNIQAPNGSGPSPTTADLVKTAVD